MSHFDFKQFRICHDKCAMKVGTDGVLLGAWAEVSRFQNTLDIGTGTGLIAIMLAQRTTGSITGIDIDPSAVEQARENAAASPFSMQVSIQEADIKDFAPAERYDNIVSNPPYFEEAVLPPDANRAAARHTSGLSLRDLVVNAQRLLLPDGSFQVILPYSAADKFISLCAINALSLMRRTDVCTKEGKPYKRSLLHFINNIAATTPHRDVLFLSDGKGGRAADYQRLTQDYYL